MDSSFSLVVASRLCSDFVASATYIWWSCNSHAFSRGAEFPWHMKECPWSMPDCQIDNYGLPCLIVISFSVIVDNKTNLNLDLAIEWISGNTGSVWESAKDQWHWSCYYNRIIIYRGWLQRDCHDYLITFSPISRGDSGRKLRKMIVVF